jgi:hypothetical protein
MITEACGATNPYGRTVTTDAPAPSALIGYDQWHQMGGAARAVGLGLAAQRVDVSEQAEIAGGNTARVYRFHLERLSDHAPACRKLS